MAKENVVAVGLGYKTINGVRIKEMSIVCSVVKKVPLKDLKKKDRIPKKIEGISTDVNQTGRFRALKARTDRWRPAPPGVSIGHEHITAGTFGAVVKKKGEEGLYILSNNHVLANSNEGAIGSAILQPGKYDGGTYPKDMIARLVDFVEIEWMGGQGCQIGQAVAGAFNLSTRAFGFKTRLMAIREESPVNYVDAAIAKPLNDDLVERDILEIGIPEGFNHNHHVGMEIQKSGRTTGLTGGVIEQVDVMVQVSYGDGKIALFDEQLIAGNISAGGDSGSVVFDLNKKIVGLLFAGSDTVTVINTVDDVWRLLELDNELPLP
jgi:hypothetical protein